MSTESPTAPSVYRLGDCLVTPDSGVIQQNGRSVHLEPKAVDLLCYLLDRPGEIVSTDELLDAVWQGRVVEATAITRNMALIRRALGDDAKSPRFIETIPKRGYRTVADVQVVTRSDSARIDPGNRWVARIAFGVIVLVAFATWFVQFDSSPNPGAKQTVAVLPLKNLTANDEQGWIADGLTQEIRFQIAAWQRFRVLPPHIGAEPQHRNTGRYGRLRSRRLRAGS